MHLCAEGILNEHRDKYQHNTTQYERRVHKGRRLGLKPYLGTHTIDLIRTIRSSCALCILIHSFLFIRQNIMLDMIEQ